MRHFSEHLAGEEQFSSNQNSNPNLSRSSNQIPIHKQPNQQVWIKSENNKQKDKDLHFKFKISRDKNEIITEFQKKFIKSLAAYYKRRELTIRKGASRRRKEKKSEIKKGASRGRKERNQRLKNQATICQTKKKS